MSIFLVIFGAKSLDPTSCHCQDVRLHGLWQTRHCLVPSGRASLSCLIKSLCFFAPGDPDDLASAILELFQQPDKRQVLIGNSQKLYDQYKWEK